MKYLLIPIALLFSQMAISQTCCTTDHVFTMSGGNPFNVYFEGGFQKEVIGGSLGIKTYQTSIKQKDGSYIAGMNLTGYARGIVEFVYIDNFRGYVTAWGGYKAYGVSLRMGYILNNDIMLLVEPSYAKETNGATLNAGLSIRF